MGACEPTANQTRNILKGDHRRRAALPEHPCLERLGRISAEWRQRMSEACDRASNQCSRALGISRVWATRSL
jgi:hypothetical protein